MVDRIPTSLSALTAKLVAAYVRGNAIPPDGLADLIQLTHASLAKIRTPPQSDFEEQRPAAPIKKSIQADVLVCLECGAHKKMLKRHLHTAHSLTTEDYRAKWRLPPDYPMTAPDYAKLRSHYAKKAGLGKKKTA